jgi:hypothetical protein
MVMIYPRMVHLCLWMSLMEALAHLVMLLWQQIGHSAGKIFYQAQLFVQVMANHPKWHHMDSRKLLDRNMAASYNCGDHRHDYLAWQDHFLRIEVPLAGCTFLALRPFHYFIYLFPLEAFMPIHNVYHILLFLRRFFWLWWGRRQSYALLSCCCWEGVGVTSHPPPWSADSRGQYGWWHNNKSCVKRPNL